MVSVLPTACVHGLGFALGRSRGGSAPPKISAAMRLNRAIALAVVCAVGLFGAVPAASAKKPALPSNPVLQDCLLHRKGLTGHYTVQQLRHALQVMPQETQEYTSCPDVINRALLARLSVGSGHGDGSGSFLPVPVLIVLALLVVAGAGFGAQALRNRNRGE